MKRMLGTILLIIAALIYGLVNKKSLRTEKQLKNDMDDFYVGAFPDEMMDNTVTRYKKELENSSHYILLVECLEDMRFEYSSATQKVRVKRIFKGEGINVGDEVNVVKIGFTFFSEEGMPKSMNMSFAGEMIKNKEYLVFLDQKTAVNGMIPVMMSPEGFPVQPIFSTEFNTVGWHESAIEGSTFVKYSDVKNEEFFLMSEDSVEKWMDLKKELIGRYITDK